MGKSNRDKYAHELAPMLHGYGAFTRTAPTVKPGQKVVPIQRSSADTYFLLNGGGAIEAKTGYSGIFPMGTEPFTGTGWRLDQIQWARDFRALSGCEYWLFVVYETEESPWRVPRDAFLVPFQAAVDVMDLIPQKGLPYKVRKHMNVEMQENNWDAVTLWSKYALDWKSGWKVPEIHIFHRMYIAPTSQVLTIEEITTTEDENGSSVPVSWASS